MSRSKKKLLFFIIPIVLVLFLIVYLNDYYIDTRQMHLAIGQGAWESPDGNLEITIALYPIADIGHMNVDEMQAFVEQNNDDVFVIGSLRWNPTVREDGAIVWSDKNQKIIFYDKYDGSPCTVVWLDNMTATINGITLKLPGQTFDYRRAWETR